MSMHDDVSEILVSSASLETRIRQLGAEISADYEADSRPLLVCILKGAYMFLSDLTKQLTIPHKVDFMATSAYGGGLDSRGVVRLVLDLETNIRDQHVLLVEDIVDHGATINYLLRLLRTRNPASLRVCTLLNKPARRQYDVPLDYIGFDIPDQFVIGYGLDIDEMYRNLPYIGVPTPELIDKLVGSTRERRDADDGPG